MKIPSSGQLTFSNIGLSDVGSGIILQFGIETEPASNYSSLTATTNAIDVSQREYYLVVAEDVTADLALPFSLVVEVRDVGTDLIALPWKAVWTMSVALTVNPSNASFAGTHTVNVVNATANFTDLEIDELGNGYTVEVTSSAGQKVSLESVDQSKGEFPFPLFLSERLDKTPYTRY